MEIRRDNGKNSLDRINEVERKIGYTFPRSYVDLIKEHDAVRLENNIFDFRNLYNKQDERDLNFISFKFDHLNGEIVDYQQNISDLNNYGIKDLVIFGKCGNGDLT